MDRRAFIGSLAVGLLAAPLAAQGTILQEHWRLAFRRARSSRNYGASATRISADVVATRTTVSTR